MSNSQVALRLTCPCTNRTYASRSSLKAHQKSKLHQAWAAKNEIKELRVRLGTQEAKITMLTKDKGWLEEQVLRLMKEKDEFAKTVKHLRFLNTKLTQQISELRKPSLSKK